MRTFRKMALGAAMAALAVVSTTLAGATSAVVNSIVLHP